MPKENKKRGRRAEQKKRKLEAEAAYDDEEEIAAKRQRRHSGGNHDAKADYHVSVDVQQYQEEGERPRTDKPFYGLLDDEEQEYFRKAGDMLELNQFSGPEERKDFVASVYREVDGKELKLANSQSGSRVLERLIQLSTSSQLKFLFQRFGENFLNLVQHRFASHCCEALFVQAAPLVASELLDAPAQSGIIIAENEFLTMEEYFINTAKELEGNLGYLMTDRFGSHTLRMLLLVLSGQPIVRSASKSMVQSRRKERITVMGAEDRQEENLEQRLVPRSFDDKLEEMISNCVKGMESNQLRSLALHQTGNPMLQLLIQVEQTKFGKQRAKHESSLIHQLLPDDPLVEDTESGKFVNALTYDPIGSRLLETILEYAPGKTFKAIYKGFFKDRLGKLARNDIASYVVSKALARLSKEDLQDVVERITPEIPYLLERNRTVVIRSLIERCGHRGADTSPIAKQIKATYGGPNGFDIARLLKVRDSQQQSKSEPHSGIDSSAQSSALPTDISSTCSNAAANDKVHPSLLAQAMLSTPGPLSALILHSLSDLPAPLILSLAHDSSTAPTLIAALSSPHAPLIARRKLIARFYGHVGEMAMHPAASRVVDAVWTGTQGLAFMRERVAEELAENEASLRESAVGRCVWRNWRMDMYRRRRQEWILKSRNSAGSDGFVGFPEGRGPGGDDADAGPGGSGGLGKGKADGKDSSKKHMTALERARERHVREKARREQVEKKRSGTGSTSESVAVA